MNLTLKVWRQDGPEATGHMDTHALEGVSPDMSFLEMMDMLNDQIIRAGGEPVAFDHDCREGICGMCSMFINGEAHGPGRGVTTCQLHMRSFNDGDTIAIEPWRAQAFPVIKDLTVDRSAFDRVIQAGGTSLSTPRATRLMPMRFPFRRNKLMTRLVRRHALVVEHALLRARMLQRCSLCPRKSLNLRSYLKASLKGNHVFSAWWSRWIRKASETARIRVLVLWSVPRALI